MNIASNTRNNTINFFQDWNANSGNFKGRFILFFFRAAFFIRKSTILSIFFFWYLFLYRFIIEWLLNIEIHWNVKAGPDLILEHGHGTVINGSAILGKNCTIRHLTTIGNKKNRNGTFSSSPIIGDNVDIGANVSIIGEISIGDNVTIGAGTVITKNIPSNSTVVGNPARIIFNK